MAANYLENVKRLNKFLNERADFEEECAKNLPSPHRESFTKRAVDIRKLSEPLILKGNYK